MDYHECPFCHGEGVVPDPHSGGILDTKCPVCDGTGEVYGDVSIEYRLEEYDDDDAGY